LALCTTLIKLMVSEKSLRFDFVWVAVMTINKAKPMPARKTRNFMGFPQFLALSPWP
jgi:hypothetical protein